MPVGNVTKYNFLGKALFYVDLDAASPIATLSGAAFEVLGCIPANGRFRTV